MKSRPPREAMELASQSSPSPGSRSSFAYLFERFPSFVQTFVYREAVEMVRQGMQPWPVSLRRPDDAGELAETSVIDVFYAVEPKELRTEVDAQRAAHRLSWRARRAIPRHRTEPDAQRMFEAIWLAPRLRERGVRHIHAHFGGVAARTAWWLRRLFGFSYSFTGHANDIFCETDFLITNAMLVRDARLVITETDFARRWIEEKYPSARGKVHRVFNGLDVQNFPPQSRPGAVPRIISVGRYVEKKGFPDLIAACGLLRDRGVRFECLIAGGGPLQASLQDQIDRARLSACVKLPGPRPQSEVRRLLAESQLFALACVPDREGGSDNLPTVIAEAMACGLPVVSTRLAGIPEMITHDYDGLLAPPSEPAAFADALERLLRDPVLAARLGAQARESARAKFSIEATTRTLKHLLVRRARVVAPLAARLADPTFPPRSRLALLLDFR